MEQALHRDVIGAGAPSNTPWAILVVDDDAGMRQSLRLCLEAAGARVLGVATGGAALEALDRGHFDIVFLDLWRFPSHHRRRSDLTGAAVRNPRRC
jgi:PleD family two-component response regulator